MNITDAVASLQFLFAGGEADCLDAVDANDDNELALTDPVYLLNYLFVGGPPPVAPFRDCGPEASTADEEIGCEASPKHCP